MQEITFAELLREFPNHGSHLHNLVTSRGATHFVVFENQDLSSSHLGEKSGIAIGSDFTYKTLEEVEGKWLGDLPSQRKYPVRFCCTINSQL